VIYSEFRYKYPSSYEVHEHEVECVACEKFTKRYTEQTSSEDL